MDQPESEPPKGTAQDISPVACEEIARRTRLFSLGELNPQDTREMRSHLATCSECMGSYRDILQTAAGLGRLHQGEREQRSIERAKHHLHQKHFGPREPGKNGNLGHRLRLILMPAAVIFILMNFAELGDPPARVEMISARGIVTIDGHRPGSLDKPYLILPGRWVRTGQFAETHIDSGLCTLDIGAESQVLVSGARPLIVRLETGRVDVDGDLRIVTVLGGITVTQGKGRLTFDEHGLHLEPESGSWLFTDQSGEHLLEHGRLVTITPDRAITLSISD